MSNKRNKEQARIASEQFQARMANTITLLNMNPFQQLNKSCIAHKEDLEYGWWSHAFRVEGDDINRYFEVALRTLFSKEQELVGWRVCCYSNGDESIEKLFLLPDLDKSDEKRVETYTKARNAYDSINNFTKKSTLTNTRGFRRY